MKNVDYADEAMVLYDSDFNMIWFTWFVNLEYYRNCVCSISDNMRSLSFWLGAAVNDW